MPRRHTPGRRLRYARLALGLTLRDVQGESSRIAQRLGNKKYLVPSSRLHEIEVEEKVPNLYRLYALAEVYRLEVIELMHWYGIPRT